MILLVAHISYNEIQKMKIDNVDYIISMSLHPLKRLAYIINKEINCDKDIAELIVSFDLDFKQLKLDLSNAMKDRIDRKLEYRKISYQHEDKIDNFCVLDYKIITIIHGQLFMMTFTTFLDSIDQSLRTQIFVSFADSNILPIKYIKNYLDDQYLRKSWYRFTNEDLLDLFIR